jgi:Peptidase family M23
MAYFNPIGKGLTIGRIDEGVDFAGSGPLYAMGDGVIKSVQNSGWPGGIYMLLHMDDGKDVYYAENIAPNVTVGQRVKGGQQIGTARGTYPFIEIGWGTGTPGVAAASGHYAEGVPTAEGKDFAALLNTFGLHIPGAAGKSTMGNSPGGSGTQTATLDSGPGSALAGFDWTLGTPFEGLNWFGKLITGTTGSFATIGDVAKSISGLTRSMSKFLELFALLFRPEFWLRVGAFFFGLLALGAGLYFLKDSLT